MNVSFRFFTFLCAAWCSLPVLEAAPPIRVPADHPTIQAAIDAAADGDRIVVAAGTYRERITLKAGVRLVSEGDDTMGTTGLLRAERTIIDGGGAGDTPGISMAERAIIDGFTVTKVGAYDEKRWQKHWEERGQNQSHEDIGHFGMPGIGADGVNCSIMNCIVHHNGHTGIALRGKDGTAPTPIVQGNVSFRNMGGGIGIMDGASGIVRGNKCFENFYAGIGHSSGAVPLVTGNECHGNIRAGIGISEGSSPVVRNNKCHRNRQAGIGTRTGSTTRPVIEGNHCFRNGMAGIGSMEEAEPVIRNNRCEENDMAGIGARSGARPIIIGNHSRNNDMAGIGLEPGCEAILWRNVCEGNQLVAIGLPEQARAVIVDNTLSREGGMPPLVAIRGGSEAILAGNTLRGGGVAGVLVEGRAILADNKIHGANPQFGQGVWLWNGSAAVGANNNVDGFKNTVTVAEGATWTGERP